MRLTDPKMIEFRDFFLSSSGMADNTTDEEQIEYVKAIQLYLSQFLSTYS